MSDTPTPPEHPAAPGSSDDTARAERDVPRYKLERAPGGSDDDSQVSGSFDAAGEREAGDAPPAPGPEDEPPMTTAETLSGIFFEPGRTFEHLRRRPRFLVAALIMAVLTTGFVYAIYSRVSYDDLVRQAVEKTPRTADLPAEQKEKVIAMQTGPVVKTINYVSRPVAIFIFLLVGGLLYLLGAMAMGKGVSYRQALSVWTYSSLPPYALAMVANIILVFLKAPEDISPEDTQRGLVRANLSVLVDPTARPALATMLGLFDVFAVYSLVLAAIGLHKVAKLSSGSAWAVVLVIWLVGAVIRVAIATAFGIPLA